MDYLYDENGMLYGFFYNGAKYFYIRDTMQNILGIIDADGTAVVQYNYSAYGECISVTGDMAGTVGEVNSFRYKGYYFDRETGFFYCKSRYYLPEWKRWLNSDDPKLLDPSSNNKMNLYCYCENDPINYFDPEGTSLLAICIILAAAAVIGAVAAGIASVHKAKKSGEDVNAKEVVKDVVLGASLGLAVAGAAIATGGVICGALGGAAAGCLGATAIQAFAMGALSFNFTAMVIAPLYGFEMQPIEYEQPSYNTNQPIF